MYLWGEELKNNKTVVAMKKMRFLKEGKPLCGTVKTIDDTPSMLWFTSMKHKCKRCDKILINNTK